MPFLLVPAHKEALVHVNLSHQAEGFSYQILPGDVVILLIFRLICSQMEDWRRCRCARAVLQHLAPAQRPRRNMTALRNVRDVNVIKLYSAWVEV